MSTYTNEDKHRAALAEMQLSYGEGKWPCASCGRVREVTDLARWYVHDDFFSLCHGVDDVSPTCFEKYRAGRADWQRAHPQSKFSPQEMR